MKRLLAPALILLLSGSLLAQSKEPLTHESMWLMKRVGAPSASPDGKWVVFSVTDPSYDEKEQSTDLWIVPADGSAAPRQITFTKAGESDVNWAPDSRRILFSAKREGDDAAQIYMLDIASGGEAQRMTAISTGARTPQLSPDGKHLLFASVVHPQTADDEANRKAAKERKERKYNVRVYDSFPIRNWDRWLDDMQVHLMVQPAERGARARDVLAGTSLVAEPGYAGRIGEGSRDEIDATWSPDGGSIVFAVTTARNTAAFAEVATDLYRTKAEGGKPERIASDQGSYRTPRISPDGKTLYAVFNPNNGKVYNLDRLVAFDWPSMKNRRVLTAGSDRSVGSYAITPDSRTIYFTDEDAGLEKIYSVPASGGNVQLAVDTDRGVYTDLQIPARGNPMVLIARWGSSINPQEVVRIEPATKTRRNLTTFNVQKAASIDWQPPRHFWFTSSRGKKIHNFIVVPPDFNESKKYPLFVLIHGGPASMWRDQISLRWNYHLLARPGYVMLMTNYTGSTGFGEAFGQGIQGDPFKGPAEEINEAADEAIRRFPFIDASRQVAGGASYGGHLANWLQATTTRYKALISHAGLINSESQWGTSDIIYGRELMNLGPIWEQGETWRTQNPIRYAKNFKTPMLLSIGEKDYRVPLNQTIENWSILQRMRIPSRLLVWPDENHWILNAENSRYFYKEVADWLARWVK
ncbi:MAG TPA: S9 family peptidase [Thermoanaerobaculia bacterium]|nr:S9 family peptidase [Thermoanaerobaculia bacterium]